MCLHASDFVHDVITVWFSQTLSVLLASIDGWHRHEQVKRKYYICGP